MSVVIYCTALVTCNHSPLSGLSIFGKMYLFYTIPHVTSAVSYERACSAHNFGKGSSLKCCYEEVSCVLCMCSLCVCVYECVYVCEMLYFSLVTLY